MAQQQSRGREFMLALVDELYEPTVAEYAKHGRVTARRIGTLNLPMAEYEIWAIPKPLAAVVRVFMRARESER